MDNEVYLKINNCTVFFLLSTLLPIKEYNTVFENIFTVCLVRTPAWMDSATKNAHMRNITRSNFSLSLLLFLLPLLICLPSVLLFSFTHFVSATLGREL